MASIYVYDSNQWGWLGLAYDKSFQVSSVSDMVEKVLQITKNEQYRSHLLLGGSGRANFQSVGTGENSDQTGDRSLQLNGNGDLLGSAGVWLPKLSGQIYKLHLLGVDDEANKSFELMLAVAKVLGVGVEIYGRNSLVKYYGDRSESVRRPTDSATVNTDAMRKRLAEYTSG
jgi:hypothetical protein